MKKEIDVIGSGIIGLTTAYELAKRGYKVTVIDQEPYSAQKCSFANGGQISVSNSEVWNTMANVKKGLKWLFKKDAPLYIHPSFEYQKLKWLSKFLVSTIRGDYTHNTITTMRMGIKSQILYNQIVHDEQIKFDRLDTGILHFYKDHHYFEEAKKTKLLYEDNGVEWKIITSQVIKEIEPNLKSIGLVGGAYTGSDWTGDIFKFCQHLEKILKRKYGVLFVHNMPSYSLNHNRLTVVCAGVGSEKLSRTIGESLNIYPVKGYSITINDCTTKLLPKVSLLDDEAKIVTATLGNRLRVAGTAEFCGENYDITRSRIEPLLKWVRSNIPQLDCSNYSQWACLRPMTPNMMPVIRQSKYKSNIFYNTGHGHLGWTLGPASAFMIADIIDGDI